MAKKMKMPKLKAPKMSALKLPAFLKNKTVLTVLVILVIATIALSVWGSLPTNRVENFDTNSSNPLVALFHAPWCGHCKRLKPIWKQVEDANPNVVQSVDCDANPEMAKKFGIKGFPTIKFLPNGFQSSPESTEEFQGDRTFEAITAFVNSKVKPTPDPTSENPMPTDPSDQPPVDPAGASPSTVSFVGRNILPNNA